MKLFERINHSKKLFFNAILVHFQFISAKHVINAKTTNSKGNAKYIYFILSTFIYKN